jgi:hypothetical protein
VPYLVRLFEKFAGVGLSVVGARRTGRRRTIFGRGFRCQLLGALRRCDGFVENKLKHCGWILSLPESLGAEDMRDLVLTKLGLKNPAVAGSGMKLLEMARGDLSQ